MLGLRSGQCHSSLRVIWIRYNLVFVRLMWSSYYESITPSPIPSFFAKDYSVLIADILNETQTLSVLLLIMSMYIGAALNWYSELIVAVFITLPEKFLANPLSSSTKLWIAGISRILLLAAFAVIPTTRAWIKEKYGEIFPRWEHRDSRTRRHPRTRWETLLLFSSIPLVIVTLSIYALFMFYIPTEPHW